MLKNGEVIVGQYLPENVYIVPVDLGMSILREFSET